MKSTIGDKIKKSPFSPIIEKRVTIPLNYNFVKVSDYERQRACDINVGNLDKVVYLPYNLFA